MVLAHATLRCFVAPLAALQLETNYPLRQTMQLLPLALEISGPVYPPLPAFSEGVLEPPSIFGIG